MGLGGRRQGVKCKRTHTLPLGNQKKKKRKKDLAKINFFLSLFFFPFRLFFLAFPFPRLPCCSIPDELQGVASEAILSP